MSESNKSLEKPRYSLNRNLIVILVLGILLLIYGAGYIILPVSILSNFQKQNCNSVLSLNGIYTGIYPAFVRDRSFSDQTAECEIYIQAVRAEENGNWRGAYDAYQAYSNTYPNGLYEKEAYEHGADMLLRLAKDQAEQESYADALTSLNLVISSFPDSGVFADALTFTPSVYTSWGGNLRDAGNFEVAERVFSDFRTWTQNNGKSELEIDALDELAQTYLDWGLALQSQKEFDAALAKFDMAAAVDPQSPFDAPAQALSDQRKLYVEWGNTLLEQNEFAAAIEKFQQGVSRSGGKNEDGVSDALANGSIQWAGQFIADEDFESALDQLAVANQTAASDAMKKSVEAALGDAYQAYSRSSGIQAKRAMRAAMMAVCDKHKEPELPIFGLNEDSIRFGIYGVDAQLPEDVAARTPGEMHYIACVEEDSHIVESRSHKEILLQVSRGYFYRIIQQYRAEVLWNISLIKTDTQDTMEKMTFTGGPPPPFLDSGGTYFYGSPPDISKVADWLKSAVK